ncbi:C4-type zinc ribbon domain-containing protein [uncultured Alloprevotella sp.]|jgi:putative zinc ribbon domain protein|uniref:zinc ribbon domain-containing protein n=1 Tax=uncultured Alloprevotella sp. TaxID=1283315 RepID=UPI00288A8365|nr:C4-type zinc ribbon domain-containing protein [uncultured Alloprevotella sp.]
MAKKIDPAELPVEQKLKNLYQLQTTLSEIDKIKTLRGELPLEVQDLEDEVEGLKTRIKKQEEDVEAFKADIAERHEKIKAAQEAIARYKQQLDSVKNNREFDMLNKEIEFQELEVQLQEKKINEAKKAIDERHASMESSNAIINERMEDLTAKRTELEDIVTETKAEEEKLREKSKSLELLIEPRLLGAFKRIRKNSRNGLGIVYVQRDACGGCFNKIPPQRQLDIRMHKKVIVCEYCGRILVDPELAGVKIEKPVEEKPKRRRATSSATSARRTTRKAAEEPAVPEAEA